MLSQDRRLPTGDVPQLHTPWVRFVSRPVDDRRDVRSGPECGRWGRRSVRFGVVWGRERDLDKLSLECSSPPLADIEQGCRVTPFDNPIPGTVTVCPTGQHRVQLPQTVPHLGSRRSGTRTAPPLCKTGPGAPSCAGTSITSSRGQLVLEIHEHRGRQHRHLQLSWTRISRGGSAQDVNTTTCTQNCAMNNSSPEKRSCSFSQPVHEHVAVPGADDQQGGKLAAMPKKRVPGCHHPSTSAKMCQTLIILSSWSRMDGKPSSTTWSWIRRTNASRITGSSSRKKKREPFSAPALVMASDGLVRTELPEVPAFPRLSPRSGH